MRYKMKKYCAAFFAALMIAGISVSCKKAPMMGAKDGKKLDVVCTIFPEYDWVKEVAGRDNQNVNIHLLLDNGVDLHSYSPSVSDIAKISKADMFVYVGGESDGWVKDALAQATNKNMIAVNLLEELGEAVKDEAEVEGMEHHHHEHGEHHHHDEDHEDVTISGLTLSQEVKAQVKNQLGSEFVKSLLAAADFQAFLKDSLTEFDGSVAQGTEIFLDTASHAHDDEGEVHLTLIERTGSGYKLHNLSLGGFKTVEDDGHDHKTPAEEKIEGLIISTKSSDANKTVDDLVDEINDSADKLATIFKYATKKGTLKSGVTLELVDGALYPVDEEGKLWYRVLVKAEKPYSKWVMLGGLKPEKHEHAHSHKTTFEDSEVKDRALSDWDGEWQSVYPYLLDGSLDEVMEHKAESGEKTAEEYKAYYTKGYETDVEKITIKNGVVTFVKNGKAASSKYNYKGYQIYVYKSGNKGVRYFFEAADTSTGAPKYIQFSDHEIAPVHPEHFHLYFGNESFAALSEEMEHWPTYYPEGLDGDEIADEMIGHDGGGHHHHHHGEAEKDEHVWLSLRHAKTLSAVLADKLAKLDPQNASVYKNNAKAYGAKLSQLDKEYAKAVKAASVNTLLFCDRFPFRYLVDDYGLSYYAAFSGCSAESEASFETVAFLSKKVDELNLNTVLTIENSNGKLPDTVIKNSASKRERAVLAMDSMQATTAKDIAGGATYLGIMEKNLEVLKAALK